MNDIWLGGLHLVIRWKLKDIYLFINIITKYSNCIIEVADIYGNGEALNEIYKIRNIKNERVSISLKFGLVGKYENGKFSVKKREFNENELLNYFENWYNKLKPFKIHSLQLHAIPIEKSFINIIKDLKKIQKKYPLIKIGCSNTSPYEVDKLLENGININFIQVQGNMIEQKILKEFLKYIKNKNINLIVNRIHSRGILTSINLNNNSDNNSRLNSSYSVQKSYTEEIKKFREHVTLVCNENKTKLEVQSLLWLLKQNEFIYPIIGGRTKDQIIECCEVLKNYSEINNISDEIILIAEQFFNNEIYKKPCYYLEQE